MRNIPIQCLRFTVLLATTAGACAREMDQEVDQGQENSATKGATTATGNGAPCGRHYNLNIIGVKNQERQPHRRRRPSDLRPTRRHRQDQALRR